MIKGKSLMFFLTAHIFTNWFFVTFVLEKNLLNLLDMVKCFKMKSSRGRDNQSYTHCLMFEIGDEVWINEKPLFVQKEG